MQNGSYRIFKDKVVIRIKDRLCETPTELLSSKLFLQILTQCIDYPLPTKFAPAGHF